MSNDRDQVVSMCEKCWIHRSLDLAFLFLPALSGDTVCQGSGVKVQPRIIVTDVFSVMKFTVSAKVESSLLLSVKHTFN